MSEETNILVGGIISLVIFVLVAMIMMGIGIVQLRSKNPVGFYSGEEPPKESELTDVRAWNKRHGLMWLIYGIIIILSWCAAAVMEVAVGDTVWIILPMLGGTMFPIVIMIWYHNRLRRKYMK